MPPPPTTATGSPGRSPDAVVRTADGHHVVVGGRRWQATDPEIPDALRAELTAALMAARRAVGQAAGDPVRRAEARRRVHDAKLALGERGPGWWLAAPDHRRDRAAATIRALLAGRRAGASVCPSEIARVAYGSQWRARLGEVRAVAADLAGAGTIEITQRGGVVDPAGPIRGPVRFRSA